MKGLKRASKAAVSLWLSAVMTVLPAAGGMIVPAYGMELTENAGDADTGSFDGYEAAADGLADVIAERPKSRLFCHRNGSLTSL